MMTVVPCNMHRLAGSRMTSMRRRVARRLKDVRHKCISNADVIESIGQMWWNPRNGFNRETALFGVALTPYVAQLRCEQPAHP